MIILICNVASAMFPVSSVANVFLSQLPSLSLLLLLHRISVRHLPFLVIMICFNPGTYLNSHKSEMNEYGLFDISCPATARSQNYWINRSE